jgi:thiol-disulfide isomerase/thioredoxin
MNRVALLIALAACDQPAPTPRPRVELIEAAATSDIAALVVPELARAQRDHKHLVVYVGASWCEPCRRFHAAAERGELDARFGDARFLVFDRDRDLDALDVAGYRSEYIPLFAIPGADGNASGAKIEGSIKGDGAVGQIAPRLRALIDRPSGR